MDTFLEDYSEKDMIGSLLDEEESQSPNSLKKGAHSISHSNISNSSFPKVAKQTIQSIQELNDLHETTNPSGSETKPRDQFQYEFPSLMDAQPLNQFYFNNFQEPGPLPALMRPHSCSTEDQYLHQLYQNQMQGGLLNRSQHDLISNYQPQFMQARQRFLGQDAYFSQKRPRKAPVSEIFNDGHLIQKCQDQYASLQVQQQFENGSEHQKEKIFQALEPELYMLAKHKFGNYVIQKIIEKGTQQQRSVVFERIQGNILDMCFDKFGCRVIQKVLEFIINKPQQQHIFLSAIKPKIIQLIFDQCGNHVIQKTIDQTPMSQTEFILKAVEQNVELIVSHSYGCRIAQKCLEVYSNEYLQLLYDLLTPLVDRLAYCQYGNYIVQHMIKNGPPNCIYLVKEFIFNNLLDVCRDKFASNVAQKFIQKPENIKIFFEFIFQNYIGNIPLIIILINDQYGNYVIQQLYCQCDEIYKQLIFQFVHSIDENSFTQFGRHFLRFLQS